MGTKREKMNPTLAEQFGISNDRFWFNIDQIERMFRSQEPCGVSYDVATGKHVVDDRVSREDVGRAVERCAQMDRSFGSVALSSPALDESLDHNSLLTCKKMNTMFGYGVRNKPAVKACCSNGGAQTLQIRNKRKLNQEKVGTLNRGSGWKLTNETYKQESEAKSNVRRSMFTSERSQDGPCSSTRLNTEALVVWKPRKTVGSQALVNRSMFIREHIQEGPVGCTNGSEALVRSRPKQSMFISEEPIDGPSSLCHQRLEITEITEQELPPKMLAITYPQTPVQNVSAMLNRITRSTSKKAREQALASKVTSKSFSKSVYGFKSRDSVVKVWIDDVSRRTLTKDFERCEVVEEFAKTMRRAVARARQRNSLMMAGYNDGVSRSQRRRTR